MFIVCILHFIGFQSFVCFLYLSVRSPFRLFFLSRSSHPHGARRERRPYFCFWKNHGERIVRRQCSAPRFHRPDDFTARRAAKQRDDLAVSLHRAAIAPYLTIYAPMRAALPLLFPVSLSPLLPHVSRVSFKIGDCYRIPVYCMRSL